MTRQTRGMSFIEMLVVLAVVPIITITIANSVLLFYRANTSSLEEAYQIQSGQKGVENLVHDLREATYADDGSYPIASIASSSITFYADVDRDFQVERVHYELNKNLLTRTLTNATGTPPTYTANISTSTVSEYVRNFADNVSIFTYYDSSGVAVTDTSRVADVTSVTVNIIVDVTQLHLPGEFTLRSSATFRNLRPQ